jgi:hypothetical protein
MRKNIKSVIIIALTGVIISGIFACSKDQKLNTNNVYGTWKKSFAGGSQQYEFKSDSTFIFSDLATEPVTGKVLGYHYKSTGKYRIKQSDLTLYDVKLFVNSKGDYSSEAELSETKEAAPSIVYKLKMEKKTISLSFDCPINASCIPSPIIFARQ